MGGPAVLRTKLTPYAVAELTSGDFCRMAALTSYFAARDVVMRKERYDGCGHGWTGLCPGPRDFWEALRRLPESEDSGFQPEESL